MLEGKFLLFAFGAKYPTENRFSAMKITFAQRISKRKA